MPTWTTYRQQLAKDLGAYWAAHSDDVVMTTTTMKVSAWPIASSVYSDRRFRDWMTMIPGAAAADRVRLIGTYAPTPAPAVFTVDSIWSGIAVPRNVDFELHAHGFNPDVELKDFTNEALKAIYLEREATVAVNATTGAYRTSLAPLTWLQRASDLYQFGYLNASESRELVDPFDNCHLVRWRAQGDGSTIYIEHPDRSFVTETLYVKARCRAYDYCRAAAGAFGSQSGLSLETDVAFPDEHWVSAGARVEAWARSSGLMEDAAQNRRTANQKAALEEFRRWQVVYWEAVKKRLRQKPRLAPLERSVPGGRLP